MGNLRHLRGWEESPCDWVGHGGEGRREKGKVEVGWEQHPWRVAGGGEGFPCLEGPTHGEGISGDGERPLGDPGIWGEHGQHLPFPLRPQWVCWGLRPEPLPSGACFGYAGPEPKPCATTPPTPSLFRPFFFFFAVVVLFCFIVIVLFLFFLIFIFLTLFYFLFVVTVLLFVSCLFFVCLFFAMLHGLWGLGSQAGVQAWAPVASGLRPSCWTNKELQAPGNINQCELSQRSSSWHQDPAPPNCLQTPVLDASGQTTSKRGTQPNPSKKICYRWRSKVKTYKTK